MFLCTFRRAVLCVFGAAVFSFVVSPRALAATVVVTPPGTTSCRPTLASYSTISQAVSSVPGGSTIFICPGTYAEQVVINKSLTLTGEAQNGTTGIPASGSNNPVIVSPSGGVVVNTTDLYGYPSGAPTAAQVLVQTLPNNQGVWGAPIVVTINNIAVDGSNNGTTCGPDIVGIYYQNASGTVNHVTARYQEFPLADFGCQGGLAIYAQSGYGTGTGTVTIENSSVHDYDKNGITADGAGMVATITGNYVVGIGATPLTAQNGIQMSEGASGKITGNTVTDDVYINPSDCYTNGSCYSASGILLYDSGGTSGSPVTVSSNTVSNTQGGIVAVTDGAETADYNNLTSNKVTTTPAIVVTGYTYLLDGIDLCSNHNTAVTNTVFYSSGSGVHLDSSCTEPGGAASGIGTATNNTVNEACAGVLTGSNTGSASGTDTFNVVETTTAGDTCPVGNGGPSIRAAGKVKPRPLHH
jgi:hypothetical protein